jgi:outer membrane protein TolC
LETYISKAIVGETISEGLPQVTGNVDLANNFKVPTSFIPAEFIDPGAEPGTFIGVQFAPQYNGIANLGITQMVFDGSYFVGLKASRTFQELSRKDHIRTKIDVIEGVSKAYYNVLVSEEGLNLVQQNYGRLDSLLNDTKGLYESGFSEKIDVNRVQVQFNNIAVQLKNAKELYALSFATLKFQMGMPIEQPLILAEKISDLEFEDLDTNTDEFDFTQRIEYSVLQTNRQLAELDMKNNRVQYLPKLDAYAGYGFNTGTSTTSDLFDFNNNWFGNGQFGIRMSIPVFDGFYKHYKVQQNKLQIKQIEEQFDRLENNINLEVSTSKVNYQNAILNLEAQRENMVLAEEVYNVSTIKYEQGVGSSLEVVDADTAYKEAQNNYYNALFDALIAKVDFEKATGQLYEF